MDSIGTVAAPGDLRNNAGSVAGEVAIVNGFWEAGDGGGGVFYWVDVVGTDDGGTKIAAPVGGPTGYWQRLFINPVDIRWFGARAGSATYAAENSAAFVTIQDNIQNGTEAWGRGVYVPPGTFYLESDLHIYRSIDLFGDGMRSESRLMLAAGTSVVVDQADYPRSPAEHTGAECQIHDLQIVSADDFTVENDFVFDPDRFSPAEYDGTSNYTPGILVKAPANIARVHISKFNGTGIYIIGGYLIPGFGIVNQWRIHDVFITNCGGHGIHVNGGDTQGGLCTGARVLVAKGTGIYDSSAGGNTYVGCYAEEVAGRGFCAASNGGKTTFVGCFAEAQGPTKLDLGTVWFGGSVGNLTPDSALGFIGDDVGRVYPFNVLNELGSSDGGAITTYLGVRDTSHAAIGWQTSDDGDPNPAPIPPTQAWFWHRWKREQQAWVFERSASTRTTVSYVTGGTQGVAGGSMHPRGAAVQGFPSFLLGSNPTVADFARPAIRMTTGTGIPDYDPDNDIWHVGDRVFNATPGPGDIDGWVCVTAGTAVAPATAEWRAFGTIAV